MWWKPQSIILAFGAFVLSILYWPQIYGPATSPRWSYLAIILPIAILVCFVININIKIKITLAHLLLFSFICYAALSLIWTSNVYDGESELFRLVILAEAFVLGSYLTSLRDIFRGLAIGIAISSILILTDCYRAGLFVNINIIAETAVITLVGACVYKQWFYIPGLIPAIVMNESRGAILTCAIILTLNFIRISKILTISFCLLISGFIFYFSIKSYKIASLNEHYILWSDTISGFNLFGNGVGSFFTSYPFYTDRIDILINRPKFAHNDYLQIIFEFGLGSIFLIGLLINVINSKENERFVIYSILIICCFSFPFYLPVSSFLTALCCGYLIRNRSDIFVQFNDGGMALFKRYERIKSWQQHKGVKTVS